MTQVTEQELAAKSTGRRVTPADVEGFIAGEYFFTADKGVDPKEIATRENPYGEVPPELKLLSFCVLLLKNGFTVVGQAACADPSNFDPEIGKRIARADAVNKIWPLLGFQLRTDMAREKELLKGKAFWDSPESVTYIGTKVVHAEPMTRLSYNQLRGWQLPANENGADQGYLVEYTDRIEEPQHVEGYFGYVSWSPKEVFERAYRLVSVKESQHWTE